MVEFLKEIIGFLFSDSGEIPEGQFFSLLIFSVSAALLGVTVVVFDFLASFVNIKSFLKLTHKPTMLPLFILVWGLGAGFAGFLGVSLDILQMNRHTAIIAGIAWPLLMPRIVASARAEAEPEQHADDEEEEQ